jgi:NADPH:quinone reductase-like Zn-dependent oxidoreductase
MKAIRIHEYGDSGVLRIEDAPVPGIEPDDVLIKIHAAGVNPADYQFRRGDFKAFAPLAMPAILGWDVSGIVERIGRSVDRFKVGECVFAMTRMNRDGAYAEFMAANSADLAPMPSTLTFEQAAAVPLAALTAWKALFDVAHVAAGRHVLVHAGAGGVGSFAVQLAHRAGARVTATASAANVSLVRSLGADQVIDYHAQDFAESVRDVDAVLDTVGGESRAQSWRTLRPGGILAAIAMPPPDDSVAQMYGVRTAMVQVVPDGRRLQEIGEFIDAGELRVLIDSIFPLEQAAEAQRLSESRRARGKVVLKVV